jgi:hypothetical protein
LATNRPHLSTCQFNNEQLKQWILINFFTQKCLLHTATCLKATSVNTGCQCSRSLVGDSSNETAGRLDSVSNRDRCYDFLNIFAKKMRNMAFLAQNKAKLCQTIDHNIGF